MRHSENAAALFVLAFALTGCSRITTQVVEKPRVDQEIQGNRGYLMGSAPKTETKRKPTRKILQTDIELPTGSEMNPWKREGQSKKQAAPASQPAAAPAATRPAPAQQNWKKEESAPTNISPRETTVGGSTYTVQKGDTLDKISAKVYGTSKKWRKIYEANQDKLKSPEKIYPGQKLVIPALNVQPGQRASSSNDDFK